MPVDLLHGEDRTQRRASWSCNRFLVGTAGWPRWRDHDVRARRQTHPDAILSLLALAQTSPISPHSLETNLYVRFYSKSPLPLPPEDWPLFRVLLYPFSRRPPHICYSWAGEWCSRETWESYAYMSRRWGDVLRPIWDLTSSSSGIVLVDFLAIERGLTGKTFTTALTGPNRIVWNPSLQILTPVFMIAVSVRLPCLHQDDEWEVNRNRNI